MSVDIESVLTPAFQDLEDALSDFADSQYQNAVGVLSRFLLHLDEEPMAGFLRAALPPADFAAWWKQVSTTGGSMAGSGALQWPAKRPERVALQVQLCRAIQSGEIQLLAFVRQYMYTQSTLLTDQVRQFAGHLMEPLLRDIRRLAENRPIPPILFEAMGRLPPSGDSTLDALLNEACSKFRDPAPAARAAAVEKLWDAWERLKSLEDNSNKRLSLGLLIDKATDDKTFRSVLEAEARALTAIGNDFHIRHFETNRTEISRAEHYDYCFHRLYSLMHLLLFSRGISAA